MSPFSDATEFQAQLRHEYLNSVEFSGLQLANGVQLLDSPLLDKVAVLHDNDPRVTYFRFHIPALPYAELVEKRVWPIPLVLAPHGATTLDWPLSDINGLHKKINSMTATENLFLDFVIPPLIEYIRDKYAGRAVALRGTAASVVPNLRIGERKILTPTEIMTAGVENGGESAAMTSFSDDRTDDINFRSLQWLLQHPSELRVSISRVGSTSLSRMIFPVLLVYDRDKFSMGQTELPTDPKLRASVILESILLDMPLPYVIQ